MRPNDSTESGRTDIIICIHNALGDVKECLNSVLECTKQPYSLILLNDGSDEETTHFLDDFSNQKNATLITNSSGRGYTFAANQGLRESTGDYVVLLNSDTEVTPFWLERMIECAEMDEKIGIVGPLSNTASWQSIPKLNESDDWAENPLPKDLSLTDMSKLINNYSPKFFPSMTFLNGFCLLIKRELIMDIGYFDEEIFGRGYGEEDDYCIRARQNGWKLVVADHVYILHKQSRSYSNGRRKQLVRYAGNKLNEKYGQQFMIENAQLAAHNQYLMALREWFQLVLNRRQITNDFKKWKDKSVTFIVQEDKINEKIRTVLLEANTMRKLEIDANVVTLSKHPEKLNDYCEAEKYTISVFSVNDKNIPSLLNHSDVVIGTSSSTMNWLNELNLNKLKKVFYIFEFEPFLFPKNSKSYLEEINRYKQSGALLITKSRINQVLIERLIGESSVLIPPVISAPETCKINQFNQKGTLNVAVYNSTYSPFKNTSLTKRILNLISKKYKNLHINCLFINENTSFKEFESVDVLLDLSSYQPNGLMALEAMSRGVVVILPKNGIGKEFIREKRSGRLVDTRHYNECINAIKNIIENSNMRQLLQQRAQVDIYKFSPEYAVLEMFNHLL